MEPQYRARTYLNVGELEEALNQEAQANWKPTLMCSQGQGILVVYSSSDPKPALDVAAWDHGAQVAEEANIEHRFNNPREED